jgi:predicted transcriptional regulator
LKNYRRKLDLVVDILNAASKNAKKTEIMFQANLSYKLLQKYLTKIIEANLISFETEKRDYIITAKGQEFLAAYKDYSKTNIHIEKRLSDVQKKKKTLYDLLASK